jgi:hypothetical protein
VAGPRWRRLRAGNAPGGSRGGGAAEAPHGGGGGEVAALRSAEVVEADPGEVLRGESPRS